MCCCESQVAEQKQWWMKVTNRLHDCLGPGAADFLSDSSSQRPVADAGDTLPSGRRTFIAINQNELNVKQTSFKHPVIPLASSQTCLKENLTPTHPDVPGMSTCDQKRQTSYPPEHHCTFDATYMYKEIIRIHLREHLRSEETHKILTET